MMRLTVEFPMTWGELRKFVELGEHMPEDVDVDLAMDPLGHNEVDGLVVTVEAD